MGGAGRTHGNEKGVVLQNSVRKTWRKDITRKA